VYYLLICSAIIITVIISEYLLERSLVSICCFSGILIKRGSFTDQNQCILKDSAYFTD